MISFTSGSAVLETLTAIPNLSECPAFNHYKAVAARFIAAV
jgi:hypothetical protein